MKAVFIERFGGPDVLKYGDLPDPVAGPGQIVVDVSRLFKWPKGEKNEFNDPGAYIPL